MPALFALAPDAPLRSDEEAVTIRRSRSRGGGEALADAVLVERAGRGDSIAFSELVNRHYPRAVRVAFGLLDSRADAEDVVQEAFARVHRRLASFQGNSGFYTWLYRIVVNLSIDKLRHYKRQRWFGVADERLLDQAPPLWHGVDGRDPRLSVERRELGERLQRALAQLPEIHRAVLLLRELEGMSYDEIARALGVKKGTVMSRLFHARRAMQRELSEEPR